MADVRKEGDLERRDAEDALEGEPPVVARLLIEIRSDGSRTVARGAMEDVRAGERVALRAEGRTPLELAFSLARMMFRLPSLTRSAARAFLSGGKR